MARTETPATPNVDLSALLASASTDVLPTVNIPDAIVSYLADEVNTFASHNNRFRRTLNIKNDALALGILANRPTAQRLTGIDLYEAAAKEFGRQVRQFAADHKLSSAVDRNVATVTFRFAKPTAASKNGEVTVSHMSDADVNQAMADAESAADRAMEASAADAE